MIEAALRTHALASAPLVALVGGRIYPSVLPQNPTYPAITYFRVSGPRLYDHGGASGMAEARIQFDCWASTYSAVKAVAAALRVALSGYSGTVGGVTIASIYLDSEIDSYEPNEGDTGDRRVSMDFMIRYYE